MARTNQEPKNRQVQGPPDQLLTVRQVAKLLAVSTTTVYRLTRSGEISSLKVGGSLRFRSRDIAAYADGEIVTATRYAPKSNVEPTRLNFAFPVKRRRGGWD